MAWIDRREDRGCWFNEDAADAANLSPGDARTALGVELWPRVNSGLCLLDRAAVLLSDAENESATDAQLLLVEPVPLRAAVEANRKEAFELVLARLDSTDGSALFGGRSTSGSLPSRAGYYIGYLVAREAAKTHSLEQLAAMPEAEVRPLIRSVVQRLAKEAGAN